MYTLIQLPRCLRLRRARLLPVLLTATLAGCNSILETTPVDQLPTADAFKDVAGARAALVGAYSTLESGSYYGGDHIFFGELSSNNVLFVGDQSQYAEADGHQLQPNNSYISLMWSVPYQGIDRANHVIEGVPGVPGLSDGDKSQMMGEAYLLRALHHFNLMRYFGPIPLRDHSVTPAAAGATPRSPAADVYALIIADLQKAATMITDNSSTRHATAGAAKALLARAYLYQGDWANASATADEVYAMGYTLADDYADLFQGDGSNDTPEDIMRVTFTSAQFNYFYYYAPKDSGGKFEFAPNAHLIAAFDSEPGDLREAWSIKGTGGDAFVSKFPTTLGLENPHVIRFAEVILIKAEALAQQGMLAQAVDEYNKIRHRAGLANHTLGTQVHNQDDVMAEIRRQRRLELAFEGDYWPDLVRSGRATTVLGISQNQTLYPIPQAEIDVSPGLVQNPGY